MLRILQTRPFRFASVPKRCFSTNTTNFAENPFSVASSNDEPASAVSHSQKKLKNEPFLKNLFAGKYVYEYLSFPEYATNAEINDLNKRVIDPLKKANPADESTSTQRRQKEALNLYNNMSLFSSALPKQFGGMCMEDSTSTSVCRLLEEFATNYPLSYGINFIYGNELAAKAILMYGSAQHKANYLTRISNGQLKAAFCFSEPDNGYDVAKFKTWATPQADGSFVINGKKSWTTILSTPKLE